MTITEKDLIMEALGEVLDNILQHNPQQEQKTEKIEMLTIKEAAEQVSGLSTHTVRQLVLQGKIPSMRTGEGKSGKILVPKAALIDYITTGKISE